METVRQQAQYGDDVAALTLGMAYEIGRNVPQSCAQAAHWVAVAAGEGNSAAQYNLALRYVSGDGTPTDPDEARKWLQKAARRGYQKARLTLQGLHSWLENQISQAHGHHSLLISVQAASLRMPVGVERVQHYASGTPSTRIMFVFAERCRIALSSA
jgi:TPR repeat protein